MHREMTTNMVVVVGLLALAASTCMAEPVDPAHEFRKVGAAPATLWSDIPFHDGGDFAQCEATNPDSKQPRGSA